MENASSRRSCPISCPCQRRSSRDGSAASSTWDWAAMDRDSTETNIMATSTSATTAAHCWLNTETLKTRFGDFEFKGGYPAGNTPDRLFEAQMLNRAIEVYLTNLMAVSEIAVREGLRAF